MSPAAGRRGFTLIELLVAITIIGLLMPAIETARKTDVGSLPGTPGAPRIFSFGTQQRTVTPVAVFYCPSRRRAKNYPAQTNEVPFNCGRPGATAKSDYAANGGDWKDPNDFLEGPTFACLQTYPACSGGKISGPATDWLNNQDIARSTGVVTRRSEFKADDLTDGMSMTLLASKKYVNPDRYRTNNHAEAGDNNDPWLGKDWDTIRWTSRAPQGDAPGVSDSERFGSAHPTAIGAAACDGAVRGIAYAIDPTVWRRLGNRRDAGDGPASWPGR